MPDNAKALPITEKLLVFTYALTFDEYVKTTPHSQALLVRRCREIRMAPEDQLFFVSYPDVIHLWVLVTDDSPDTIAVLPALVHIARSSLHIDLRIVSDDGDLSGLAALLDETPLLDSLSEVELPLVVLFDEEWQYQGHWGPHPQAIESYFDQWLVRHPEYETLADAETEDTQDTYARLLDCLTDEMRMWYNSGLNQACVREIRAMLSAIQEDENSDEADE